MNSSIYIPANIAVTLAAGSTGSPYFLNMVVNQTLTRKTCASLTPVFNPTITIKSITATGATGQYVALAHVEGVVSYNPCGGGGVARQQNVSEDVVIPIYSATAPTAVSVAINTITNKAKAVGCNNCTRNFESDITLSLTVTTS